MRWAGLLAIGVVGGALLASLALRHYYGRLCLERIRGEVEAAVHVEVPSGSQGPVLLLLGDSRIAQWGAPRFPGWRVANGGVPWLTTLQLERLSADPIREVRPAAVFIQAGINDLKVLGVRSDLRETILTGCVEHLEGVVEEARRLGARVWVSTVWPTGPVPWERRLFWGAAVEQGVEELNRRLRERFAGREGVVVIDPFAPVGGASPLPALVPRFRDTLHLSPETYEELTTRISGLLGSPGTNKPE